MFIGFINLVIAEIALNLHFFVFELQVLINCGNPGLDLRACCNQRPFLLQEKDRGQLVEQIFLAILDSFKGLDESFPLQIPDIDHVVGVEDDKLILIIVNMHVDHRLRLIGVDNMDDFIGEDTVEHQLAIQRPEDKDFVFGRIS